MESSTSPYALTEKITWNEIEEVEPDEYEKKVLAAWEAGDPEYQPYMTHEELIAELGLK